MLCSIHFFVVRIRQNHPDRDEEFIQYKCQKHRFQKCYKSGMDDAYVKGNILVRFHEIHPIANH